jgi:hypothetical protein
MVLYNCFTAVTQLKHSSKACVIDFTKQFLWTFTNTAYFAKPHPHPSAMVLMTLYLCNIALCPPPPPPPGPLPAALHSNALWMVEKHIARAQL